MCGIVAVVRRPSDRTPPSLDQLADELRRATGHLEGDVAFDALAGALDLAAAHVEAVDVALRGVPGVQALLADPAGAAALGAELGTEHQLLGLIEARLDADGEIDPDD